jgi:hypothetical protein
MQRSTDRIYTTHVGSLARPPALLTPADQAHDTLFRRLHDDLAALADEPGLRPDLMVVTGDLAERGKRGEFDQVTEFLTAFSPDSTQLATASADGTVRIWDTATGAISATLMASSEGGSAVLLPDGGYKLFGNVRGALWWAIKLCRFEPGELDPYVDGLRRLPAGTRILP